MNEITQKLISLSETQYKHFSASLMPTINPDTVLGVRVPLIRKYAKEIFNTPPAKYFIKDLPHKYFEENNLHAFLIEKITDYDLLIEELNLFLPYVDNWATCDTMSPKCLKSHKEKLLKQIKVWLKSKDTYTVRFAIKCLMQHFLDEDFNKEYLKTVANIKSEEYYINMMCAWFFQEAITKQYESSIVYFENNLLSPFVHNKAIQKCCDSFRISEEKKQYLKNLRRK